MKSHQYPPLEHTYLEQNIELLTLKETEVEKMICRAKSSGKRHGINLKHGTGNPGMGDCAFEAIIQNNNDRCCFVTKYTKPIQFYRMA